MRIISDANLGRLLYDSASIKLLIVLWNTPDEAPESVALYQKFGHRDPTGNGTPGSAGLNTALSGLFAGILYASGQ
jgi:hypothetical protein